MIADLAVAYVALKRIPGAAVWADRGLRQYKDFSWRDAATGESLTFGKLREKLRSSDMALAQGAGRRFRRRSWMRADGRCWVRRWMKDRRQGYWRRAR